MLEEIKPGVFGEKATDDVLYISPAKLKALAKEKNLPNILSVEQVAILLNREFDDFFSEIVNYSVRIVSDSNLTPVIERADYKQHLEKIDEWPLPKDCLLSRWWSDDEHRPCQMPDDCGKSKTEDEKFNRVSEKYLFELWQELGRPDIAGFQKAIKDLKNHKNDSPIGNCYGAGTRGKNQWAFEIVINGDKKKIPYCTLGNKIREFKKLVNHSK